MMQIELTFKGKRVVADLSNGHNLAIPIRNGLHNPNCFWAPAPEFSPVRAGDFVGSTAAGGPLNFFNVFFNPHGNGTHTECVGHISKEPYVLQECLEGSHFMAKVVSLLPTKTDNGDRVLLRHQLEEILAPREVEALIIRTLPNDTLKMQRNYSGSNPPYLEAAAAAYLAASGVEHLLLDLPSVDREEDGGALAAHRAFWQYPEAVRKKCTISEMIFVPDHIPDGYYLLNLQTSCFDLDVSPSKPEIYALYPTE